MDAPSTQAATATKVSGRTWLDRVFTLWIVLAVAASVKVLVQPTCHTAYPVFAVAAHHWWTDAPLYVDYAGLDLFRYSPTLAVFMTPFGLLPHSLGGILWNLLGVGLLVWSTRMLIRDVLPGPWPQWREALLLGLMLVGATRGIWSGQSNALLISLIFFGVAAVRRQRWWSAAFLLTGAVFIKIWPLALVMLLAALWPRQLIPRVAWPVPWWRCAVSDPAVFGRLRPIPWLVHDAHHDTVGAMARLPRRLDHLGIPRAARPSQGLPGPAVDRCAGGARLESLAAASNSG